MEITKEMLIAEFKKQIDFAKFIESNHTAPFRKEFLEFAIKYILDLEYENKRLIESCLCSFFELDSQQIVYDTVTEMVEKLKQGRERQDGIAFDLVSFETIDRIAEEMIGETK